MFLKLFLYKYLLIGSTNSESKIGNGEDQDGPMFPIRYVKPLQLYSIHLHTFEDGWLKAKHPVKMCSKPFSEMEIYTIIYTKITSCNTKYCVASNNKMIAAVKKLWHACKVKITHIYSHFNILYKTHAYFKYPTKYHIIV